MTLSVFDCGSFGSVSPWHLALIVRTIAYCSGRNLVVVVDRVKVMMNLSLCFRSRRWSSKVDEGSFVEQIGLAQHVVAIVFWGLRS